MAVKVRQRKGKWWVLIDHKGKRKAKCIGDSQRTAKLFAEKMEAALLLGQFDLNKPDHHRPFDGYFTHWLNTYARAHCKASTVDRYQRTFRLYLSPAMKNKSLGAISREDVKTLVYGLVNAGKSRNTIKAVLTPLIEVFNHAVEDGHLVTNPALRVMRRTRAEEGERQQVATFLTRDELGVLLRTCQEHFPGSYPFVSLLARTGLRLGEAIAAQWGDVDLHGRFLEVKRSSTAGRVTSPKNGKTRRVDLSQQLTETLKAAMLERKQETLRKGWGEVPPWIFISGEGTPINSGHFRWRIWRALLAKAGLRYIRIHDLRHTYASLLLQNGESLVYVKDQMGHHSIQVTVDTYGHLMPGGNKAAVDRLDGLENATVRNPGATTTLNIVSATGRSHG